MEYIVKKCLKCGKVIRVLKNTNTTTLCCNEEMKELKPNTEDASYEKHIPCFEIKDNKIIIKLNNVMDNDHYIEWISVITNNQEIIKYSIQNILHKNGTFSVRIYFYNSISLNIVLK